MTKANVYYIPESRFADVPKFIAKAAGEFFKNGDFVAIKLHFGEKGCKGFIHPEWVKPVSDYVKVGGGVPFLTDTTTIYRGSRSDAASHLMIANGHGFTIQKAGAPVIIADGLRGNDFVDVPVACENYKSVRIARAIHDASAMIVLSHTKGHILTGFGGAVKNLGMGCASKPGKYDMHAGVVPSVTVDKCVGCGKCVKHCAGYALTVKNKKIVMDESKCVGCGDCIIACPEKVFDIQWEDNADVVSVKIAEHACGAVVGKPVCYVNYMHFISKYCDCMPSEPTDPYLDNLGILISTDPVAIDQASIDFINAKAGRDIFKELNPVDYNVHLAHAEKMGLGSRQYAIHNG